MNCIIQITAHEITANTKLVPGWKNKIKLMFLLTLANLTESVVWKYTIPMDINILKSYCSFIPTSETFHILWCKSDPSSSAEVGTKQTWQKLPDVFCFWWHLPVPVFVTVSPWEPAMGSLAPIARTQIGSPALMHKAAMSSPALKKHKRDASSHQ